MLNFSWTSQSKCLFVPLFLKKNWIYLSETLLEPTGHFFNGQKRQQKAERFWFGVNFTHFCLSVFYVTLFLENHSIFSHEILHSCSWHIIRGQYTQTMPPLWWGPFFGIFGAYFGICTYFSWYLFNILPWNFAQVFLVWPWLSLILFSLTSCPHLQEVI